MALAVQPRVNSSVSPAADGSNGQETTAENKDPRCSAGPAPLAGNRLLPGAVRKGDGRKGFAPGLPSLRWTRYQKKKYRRRRRRASAGKWAALRKRRSNKSPRFGSEDRTRAKECAECGGRRWGVRGAAGGARPPSSHPPTAVLPSPSPHTDRAGRCGERSVPSSRVWDTARSFRGA